MKERATCVVILGCLGVPSSDVFRRGALLSVSRNIIKSNVTEKGLDIPISSIIVTGQKVGIPKEK